MCIVNFLNQNQGAFLVAFSFIVALATAFYAFLTRQLVKENRRLREAQTEPNVFIYPQQGLEFGVINLIIQNIGLGAAYNISFSVSPDSEISDILSKFRIFKEGINNLAPNQKLWIFSARVSQLEDEELKPIEIDISFENYRKKPHTNSVLIDFAELKNVGMYEESSMQNIHVDLKEISHSLSGVASAINKKLV